MHKHIVDGKVAVLVSPGWGAGWSTWLKNEQSIFDTTLVKLVLSEQWDAVYEHAKDIYPDSLQSGVENLTVSWVPVGTEFRISEYDGNEYIEVKDKISWITA
jgi:hypothetical protein